MLTHFWAIDNKGDKCDNHPKYGGGQNKRLIHETVRLLRRAATLDKDAIIVMRFNHAESMPICSIKL